MNDLNVLFIGIGSIAKRHIYNLQNIAKKRRICIKIHALRTSTGKPLFDGVARNFYNFSEITETYDIVFITNPTKMHLDTLKRVHEKGKHFFIEKPVVSVDQIEEAKQFPFRDGSLYYVACPLRYNPVIQYIRKNIYANNVISVRSISSSYLPEWRPGQDYRTVYSAHKDMGGGVSVDLVHEWDYLTYLFGWPHRVSAFFGKKSSLEIDSEDYAVYIAEYENKIVELHLDYFGRKTIREIQLFTSDDTIVGDIVNNRISYLKRGETIDFYEERDDYQQRELEHVLDIIMENGFSEDEFRHGLAVLELTQGRL